MEAFEMTGPSGNKYRIDENGDVFLLEKTTEQMETKQTKDIHLARCQVTREISLSGNTTSLNLAQTEKLAELLTRLHWSFARIAPCGTVYACKG